MSAHPLILTLDQHGVPHRWVSWQHACFYYAKNLVAWTIGEHSFVIHGGLNRVTGKRSEIAANSIIAIKGKALAGKSLVIGCPKLDDTGEYVEKLTQIFRSSGVKSVTVIHMEVPCCFGIQRIVESALAAAGGRIALHEITVGLNGEIRR